MNDAALLALHREIVGIPSISHDEKPLCDWLERFLVGQGVSPTRFGNNLYAIVGQGPLLCFNTHLDTVPASPRWTRKPHDVAVVDGRVYGLGSNDAKAAVAAMTAAFVRLSRDAAALRCRLMLTLVCDEETGGLGTEILFPELVRCGLTPDAAIIGEPTGLDVAIAQKGMLVLELRGEGRACHAAHGRALNAPNAIRRLAHDIAALEGVDLGPGHEDLGPVTVEPTVITGGTARNMIPPEASCIIDVRTNPQPNQQETINRLRAAVSGELRVLSDRLRPVEIDPAHVLVRAAVRARPGARLFGSRGLSDLVFFTGVPSIKVGPGMTERSHTPDEFVLESEILDGARFFEAAAVAYGFLMQKEEACHDATVGPG